MFCVPLLHGLLIRGLEEDPTDAEDSALLAHGCFSFPVDCTRAITCAWREQDRSHACFEEILTSGYFPTFSLSLTAFKIAACTTGIGRLASIFTTRRA